MGIKRLNRSRLYNVEKKGIDIIDTMGVSLGMKPAIVSATQSREGFKVVSDIVVDLGTSKTTVKTGGAIDGAALGTLDGSGTEEVSYLCKLDASVFGAVCSVETICLEMPSDGVLLGSTSTAYELRASAAATGKIGTAPAAISLHADMNSVGDAVGTHRKTFSGDGTFTANALNNAYLYICCGAGIGATTTATATITVTDTDVSNFTSGMTHIRLTKADGTIIDFQANGAADFNAANTTNNSFNIGGTVNSAAKVAQGISIGIHGDGTVFTTDATSRGGGSATITVTQSAAGVGGNETNYFVDAPTKTAGIDVGNFIGGTTGGTSTAMTQGKFLIRVEGFMTPADI